MKKINNRWYDANNNSWSCELETEDSARIKSESLINCSRCSDCSYCSYCSYCSRCSRCSYCSDCSDCSRCSRCSDCSDWKENPQRITSPKIGSRNSNTTIYFDKDRTQVVCGCFVGTIEEFKKKVNKTHADNEHGIAYKNFIAKVEQYRQ